MNRFFTSSPAAVEFFDCPRLLTGGKPFVGARLVDRDGDPCAAAFEGVGYTKRQALLDLRDDVTPLPPSFERTDSLTLIAAVLAELPAEAEAGWQKEVHAMAQAAYRPSSQSQSTSQSQSSQSQSSGSQKPAGNRAERRRKR